MPIRGYIFHNLIITNQKLPKNQTKITYPDHFVYFNFIQRLNFWFKKSSKTLLIPFSPKVLVLSKGLSPNKSSATIKFSAWFGATAFNTIFANPAEFATFNWFLEMQCKVFWLFILTKDVSSPRFSSASTKLKNLNIHWIFSKPC